MWRNGLEASPKLPVRSVMVNYVTPWGSSHQGLSNVDEGLTSVLPQVPEEAE